MESRPASPHWPERGAVKAAAFRKNPAEAAKLYGQIKTDYPDTPIAQQAEQELALLPGKT